MNNNKIFTKILKYWKLKRPLLNILWIKKNYKETKNNKTMKLRYIKTSGIQLHIAIFSEKYISLKSFPLKGKNIKSITEDYASGH